MTSPTEPLCKSTALEPKTWLQVVKQRRTNPFTEKKRGQIWPRLSSQFSRDLQSARAAQGVSAFAQLWLFASQQQAFDVAAQVVGVQTTRCPAHPANTTASTAVYLLRRTHGDRAQKDIAIHCRAADA